MRDFELFSDSASQAADIAALTSSSLSTSPLAGACLLHGCRSERMRFSSLAVRTCPALLPMRRLGAIEDRLRIAYMCRRGSGVPLKLK